jgi:phage tail-like protein
MAEQSSSDQRPTGAATSRRGFLAGTAGLTGFALAAGAVQTAQVAAAAAGLPMAAAGAAPQLPPPSPAQGATDARLVGADFFLTLGSETGFALQGVDGGVISADVVADKSGSDNTPVKKHIAGVKYEDISISCGFDQSSSLYGWMAAAIQGKAAPMDGTVTGAAPNHTALTRMDWNNGLISEVGFPALDAASKDAAKMSIKFQPEITRFSAAAGTINRSPGKVQKQWLPSNFRLSIDGLDAPCTKVNKIEALVIKQKIIPNPSGGSVADGPVEIPSLVITLPESVAQPFIDWHQSFVVQGGNNATNPDNQERNGTLVYFAKDGTQLGQLAFSNLGIVTVTDDPTDANVRRVKAEMYCERIAFAQP